jgi:hypothetical protein
MSAGLGQLGFWTALISLGASAIAGKKAKKEAKQAAANQASIDAINEGRAVSALDVMTPEDIATLRRYWGQLRNVANLQLVPWATYGYNISPAAKAALTPIWSVVRGAANFQDVNWPLHAVPIEKVAPALPLPELGHQTPAPVLPSGFQPQNLAPFQYQSASLLPGGLTTETVLIAAAIGAVGLIIAGSQR